MEISWDTPNNLREILFASLTAEALRIKHVSQLFEGVRGAAGMLNLGNLNLRVIILSSEAAAIQTTVK